MVTLQKSISDTVSLSGKGLHTGCEVTVTLKPAVEDSGIIFKRVDIEGEPVIEASVDYVADTSRGTVLDKDGVKISTVEHLLAAITAMDIDNIIIEINAGEVPIMDGSAKFFIEALERAEVVEQSAVRKYFEVTERVVYRDEKSGVELELLPDDDYRLNVMISFDSQVLNNQYAVLNSIEDFKKDIAPCRTFVFVRELEQLIKHNLVKGGDLDSAIVIMDKKIPQEEADRLADLFDHGYVDATSIGVLNNLKLQFDNEPARHKLLDLVGDLALLGRRIKGRVIASKPGHYSNTEFCKVLKKLVIKQDADNAVPSYDPSAEPVLDVSEIRTMLPHRYPFLLVDKITEISENLIVGVKNVTVNEPFFQGHFPEEPVMPGVLILEAMAQCGGVYVINSQGEGDYSTYFVKMTNIKFRKKVIPGDTLIFKLKLMSPIRRGIANMKGWAFVGKSVVAEGEFMAQVTKK